MTRASHIAAGNTGKYPHNGAFRLRVSDYCANSLISLDPNWTNIVEE